MPVEGRINRRDNLRGKEASIKSTVANTKSSDDKKEVVPGLKFLKMLKEKNIDKKLKTKSENYISGLCNVYVYLEDINVEGSIDKKSSNLESFKRKSTRRPNKAEDEDKSSSSEKMDIETVPKKVESGQSSAVSSPNKKFEGSINKKSINLEGLKRKSTRRPNKAEDEEKSSMSDKMDVDTIVNKVESGQSSTKSSPDKNLNTKYSPERIHSSIEEGIKKRIPRMKNLIEIKSTATPTKSRMSKKMDLEEKQMDIVKEELEPINKTEVKIMKQRGRPRVIPKGNDENNKDEIKFNQSFEMMDIPQVTLENLTLPESKSKKLRLLVTEDETMRIKEVVSMDVDCDSSAIKETKVEVTTKKLGRRTAKLEENDRPFVVEPPTISDNYKIPGLIHLQNLKNRKSEIINRDKDKEDQNLTNTVGKSKSSSKIPGLLSTADIRRRKSLLITNQLVESSKEQKSEKTFENIKEEVIPDLSSTADIRRRKSILASVNEKDNVSTVPEKKESPIKCDVVPAVEKSKRKSIFEVSSKLDKDIDEKVTKTVALTKVDEATSSNKSSIKRNSCKEKTVLESSKIPGFSLIEEIRSRKSAVVTAKEEVEPSSSCTAAHVISSASTTVSSDTYTTQSFLRQPLSSSMLSTSRSSYYPSSPSILKTHIKSVDTPPVSSLARPTNKRPISCLTEDSEVCEPRVKVAKVDKPTFTPSRRQSVTFNKQVEVKEIRGNSFNSETGDGDHDSVKDELKELERKVKENMEKTKRNLANKRFGDSSSNIFSVGQKVSTSTPTSSYKLFADQNLTQRSSGLSDYLLSKKKAHIEQAAKTASLYNFSSLYNTSAVTAPQSAVSSSSTFAPQSQVTRKSKESVDVDKEMSNEISDDDMDEEERNNSGKCTIL